MKLLLCLIIVFLSSYIGRLMSKKTAHRLKVMRSYQSAIVHMCDSIIMLNMALFKAFESCNDKMFCRFFCECAALIKTHPTKSASAVWNLGFDACSTDFDGISKSDRAMIMDGGKAIETLCANPREKQADLYIRLLNEYIAALDIEKRNKCKLYNTSGVLAGLAIALLVI